MGVKFSHHRSNTPFTISVTPHPLASPPLYHADATTSSPPPKGRLREDGSTPLSLLPQKSSLVRVSSRDSLESGGSTSSKRRVSFDLLAEMAYAFPEQPLSPVLVELTDQVVVCEEEEEEEGEEGGAMGKICDGTSDSEGEESLRGGRSGRVRCGEGREVGVTREEARQGGSGQVTAWSVKVAPANGTLRNDLPEYEEEPAAGRRLGLTKMAGMENLSQEDLAEVGREEEEAGATTAAPNGQNGNVQASDMFTGAIYAEEGSDLPNGSVVRSIDVTIEIQKVAGRTLGFSIAGGRGSTPAYEDVDDSIYVTKIAPGGLAEQDGRLRLGDKLLAVNGFNMVNATHAEAVAALKSVTSSCQLVVSREVLVVLPEDVAAEEGEEQRAQQDQPTTPSHAPQQKEGDMEESGEDMAKKMVADILDRSLKRVSSDEDVLEEKKEEEEAPPPSGQHDNYINYNIAQIVVKESRKVSVGEGSTGPSLTDTESPLHARPRPAWKESDDEYMPSPTRPSVSMSLDDDEEENYPEERVVLDRSIGRLGLSIVGGADHVSRVFGQGKPGVYVSKISKGGAAAATGKLRLGDRILEVNKFNVRFSTHQQAVQWLISQEGNIELVVQHVPQPPGLKDVLLKKEPGQKLGLSIRGGGKGSKGNPLDPNDEGIFISKVTKGGAAETSGGLAIGMRIVEVNGISLLGASHSQAVKALKSSPQLLITVCDGFDVKEVMRRKSLADTLEDDTISSVTVGSHVPLSAASSMVLDTAIHGLLSESIDGLATTPRKSNKSQSAIAPSVYSLMHSQLSHSSTAISNKTTPTTTKEEDFDKLLEDLAKFKVETSLGLKQLDEEQRARRKSSPVSPLAYRQQQQQEEQEEQQKDIPLSEIIAPLQNSGMGSIEDILDPSLGLEPLSSESGVESEVGSPLKSEPSIDAELSGVELKDTSSMLADLDSEVFTMHEEVSKGESEMNKAEDAPPGDEDITPKVQRKQSLKQKVALHKKASMQQLKPTPSPANPLLASPETRRRAEEIRINISPPPDAEASEEAVKSIIGEVFNDISFDEFERRSTSPGSGTFTPTDEDHVMKEVSSMDDVLSALKGLSGASEKSSQEEKKEEEDEKEPDFGPVPAAKERARTMPVVPPPVAAKPDVTLRVKTNHSDPNWRKSAPIPDRPTSPPSVSPEKLTFKEKLALHKKKADDSSPPLTSPHHLPGHTQTKSISASAIAPPPPTINRTSSAGKVPPPSSTEDNAPSTFDDRIAFLRNNQAKAGMDPVQVKKSASSDRRMSAEERRMARIVKTEEPLESFSAPDVLKTSSPRHESADPGPSPQAASSNTNSNNNSTDFVNPYVAQILRDMPPVVTPPESMGASADPQAERGRKWREEKEKELNEKCAEFQGMIDKLSNTGILESSSSLSDSKTKAPTTLV